jgi:hypothetical protein
MVDTTSEIQAQLEAANRRLTERRRVLGIRDDQPIHIGEVVNVVLADLLRESEEVSK